MGMAEATAVPESDVFSAGVLSADVLSADVLSAEGEVGTPAGEPIEGGMMKSSRFMKSTAGADVVVLSVVVVTTV